jgi:Tfp pilus assembly protein PilV
VSATAGTLAPTRRDVAFAGCLAVLLVVGVLGVLLLNTAMQQQADRLATQHDRLAELALQAQTLRMSIDRAADPRVLAVQARRLHMRQAPLLAQLRVTPVTSGR